MHAVGFHTETYKGEPYLLTIHDGERGVASRVTPQDILQKFFDFFRKPGCYLVFGHNLKFDLVSLFYEHQEKLFEETFNFKKGRFSGKVLYSDTCYAYFESSDRRITIYIIDSFSFFPGSLANMGEKFFGLEKLEAPGLDLGVEHPIAAQDLMS